MKPFSKILVVVMVFLFLAGCAGTEQYLPYPDQSVRVEDPDLARICVKRTESARGGAIPWQVYDGDRHIGRTGPGGCLCWEREPGFVEVKGLALSESVLPINVEKGQVYYIHQGIRGYVVYASNEMKLLTKEEGEKLFKKCKAPKLILDRIPQQ